MIGIGEAKSAGEASRRLGATLSTPTVLQIVLLAGIFVLNFFEGTDPDLWWHLATGRYIVETGSIPTVDIFSYTAAGRPWVAHEWLAEIVIYLIYRSGGYVTAVIAMSGLVTATYLLVFRTVRMVGSGVIKATLITAWVAAMSWASWNVRPQVFSYLFFATYLYLLVRCRRRRDRFLWLMPISMAVWVNLHAGYVMGLILIGTFIVGEGLNRLAGESSRPSVTPLRTVVTVAAATVGATVVNPQGVGILLYPLTYAGVQNASMRFIDEWRSPDFHNYYFFIFGMAILALMAFRGRRPQDWAIALPVLILTAMTLQAVRVISFFAVAVAPYLALRLSSGAHSVPGILSGRSQDETNSRDDSPPDPARDRSKNRLGTLNWVVLIASVAVMMLPLVISEKAQVGAEPHTNDYPVDGASYIRSAGLTGNLFNTYRWGGYLAWVFYPEKRVFVDGRADMYGDERLEEYMATYNGVSAWKRVFEKYGIEVALIEKGSSLATLLSLSGEWTEAYHGPVESVFVRTSR